jgi:TP901 family phage tail tape measure protein
MADEQIVTSIVAKADLSSLVSEVHRASASLQQLQRELLSSNKAISSSTKLANNLFRDTLTGSGQFSSHFVNLNSDVDKFGKNLDAGRLKLKNYFQTFREHSTTQKGMIRELAKEQVMLQNSVLQPLGRNAQGLMQYNVMIPRGLDAIANSGKLARMEMQIMNRALSEGAGSLINWGKNTQWAGRQLTVGLTVPLTMFGAAAGKAFREADAELVRLTKVYGGLAATSASDLRAIREEVVETAKVLSKTMGASFKETIALGADIAATGQTGDELLGSIAETTRLAILGEVDRQDAMKATLSIQTAFKQNTEQLTESINFLNAVENQTSTTLNDLVEAIPKAGPVIQQLGGDVKDLALYLTAMREGGISASEGANALKSGLASLINPTKQTVGMMSDFGIDVMGMVAKNTGDTTGLLMDLQKALDSLDPLSKARAMEQMFGKFQFARMSALLNNLGKQGSQTLQVLDLMKASTADLADVASRELKMVTESASGKYKRAIEGLKAELADVGEEFLGVATKLISAATKILDFFTKLPDPIKKGLTFLAGFTALVGPLIMLTGVLANFFGYITKGVVQLRAFFMKANGWKMLTPEIIAAEKAALMVENAFYSDAAAAQVLHNALQKLVLDYQSLQAASMKNAVPVNGGVSTVAGNPVMVGGRRVVDPNDPYVGDPNTRAMSHIRPRDLNNPATIFGGVPGAIPVNRGISRTPQMYMHDRLPNIEGLTSVKGISTGIVPGEAAKFHALMATLGMQTEQEVAALKKTIAMGGTVSAELLDTFDDILPITKRFADSAATQAASIVQQMRNAEITVEQAKARILALNAQIEADMGSAVTAYAAGRGRRIDLTRAPMMDQPVVDANGQFTLRDLYKKKTNASVMEEFGRLRGVRTFGAPYSIQTTRLPKFNIGGDIESFGPSKTMVSGPSSIGYDDRLGSVPLGGYVLNQQASMDPANAALVAMAPSTYLNDGGSITAALTPRETVFGPEIQRMPELYAAVDAANNGYNFGGQIMKGINSYGKEMSKSAKARMKEENFKRQYREYLKFINNPRYEDDIRVRMIMLDAAELANHNKLPLDKAIDLATRNFDTAKTRAGGSDEKFVKIRIKQVQDLENEGLVPRVKDASGVKNSDGKTVYPRSQSKALNYQLNHVREAMINDTRFAGVRDLIEAISPTTFLNPSDNSPSIKGMHDKAHFRRLEEIGYTTSGYMGVGAVLPAGINNVMSTLETIGLSRDVLNLSSADAKENLAIALKKTGLDKFATVDDIFAALQDDGLFKSNAQIASGNVVRANKNQRKSLSMLLEAAAKKSRWIFAGRPPRPMLIAGAYNLGGMIPGGSISRNRKNYGFVSPALRLLAPAQQLKILQQAREMSAVTPAGYIPASYSHLLTPSTGRSFPVPGVAGVYQNEKKKKVFFKAVPNEVSLTAEMRGTEIGRILGLETPVQVARSIRNPLDPTGKSRFLGAESDYDEGFINPNTSVPGKFSQDEVLDQFIASMILANKDLSRANVHGRRLSDVGNGGVLAKASMNDDFAKTMPSMEEMAIINLLQVRGGARKDFAHDTAPIVAKMSAKEYGDKIKEKMEAIYPQLKSYIKSLPKKDRKPYDALLKRFEEGMDVDWSKYHAMHVNPKFNSGGPVGGGPVQRSRYAYGRKKDGSRVSGNPAKRAQQERLKAERSVTPVSRSGYTASGNPQMQVQQIPYVGGAGVFGNAFGASQTGQSQQAINTLRLSQIGQLPAGITKSFKSLTDSIKLGTVGLRYGIMNSGKYLSSAYTDYAKERINSARTTTRTIREGILREQSKRLSAAYPGQMMPVYMSGPGAGVGSLGAVSDWKQYGEDGTKTRKVGTYGYRRREFMDADGKIYNTKAAKAAGIDTRVRGGMGMGAQMGIGMAGSMGAMSLMQQEKVLGMSGMTAGLAVMGASTILPMLPWKTMASSVRSTTASIVASVKAFKNVKDAISRTGAAAGDFVKKFKALGAALSVVLIGLDIWKKYSNAQQDAAMALSITAKGAEQAGIKYFNLNQYLADYIEKQKLANAAAQGSKSNSIGMPGIPQSIDEMKKAKEDGKVLKELIESINRTSSTGELQRLINNQKAQYVAGGLSIEQANSMIYGAIANSEKASQAYRLLADQGFGAIEDKSTAAEYAVGNLVDTINSNKSVWQIFMSKDKVSWNPLALYNAATDTFADAEAQKKAVVSGFESMIGIVNLGTQALIGTKNAQGDLIDEHEAYQTMLASTEKNIPEFNIPIGKDTYETLVEMSPKLAEITNKFDTLKSIIAKTKLFTSGINIDLKGIDANLAIKLAGFTAAIGSGISELTKAGDENNTYGSTGKVLKRLQESILATSAASQKAAAVSQRNIQEEIKLIAKKISLIEDEKNKKLESLRATRDASNYALELQKLQIEYADAIARGDVSGAARARINIDQLTSNRQADLAEKAIQDEADRLKAIEQKKIDAKQAAADKKAIAFQDRQDNATSAAAIMDVVKGFKATYDEITALRITNSMMPESEAKRKAESQLVGKLDDLLKKVGAAGTGSSETAKAIRESFAQYFNKDGTVKSVYVESPGSPDATTKGVTATTITTLNKDILKILDRDVAFVSSLAIQITGGKGYSIKSMTEEIVAALKGKGTGTYSDPINAGTSIGQLGKSSINWGDQYDPNSSREQVKKFAQKKGYKPGTNFYLRESDGTVKQFLVLKDGNIQLQKVTEKADGGPIRGEGTGTSDSIPAMLSNGEYVIREKAVRKYGVQTFDALNAERLHTGGQVGHRHTGQPERPQLKYFPWNPDMPNYWSNGKPTGSPWTGRWGELRYNPSKGKDIWGGTEIPGLPFNGKFAQRSDYWHQIAEQPIKYSGPGMGLDKDPMRYAGSGASMGGIGNGVYGPGAMTFATGGFVGNKNGNWFSKFNPANAISSMLSGMFSFGASKAVNKNVNVQSTMTQQEKDRALLQTAQMLSGYTSAFNLKNNTSPEIFGNQSLGVAADLLALLPAIGGLTKLGTNSASLLSKPAAISQNSAKLSIENGILKFKKFTPEDGVKINTKAGIHSLLSRVAPDDAVPYDLMRDWKIKSTSAAEYSPSKAMITMPPDGMAGGTAVHEYAHHLDFTTKNWSFDAWLNSAKDNFDDGALAYLRKVYGSAQEIKLGQGQAAIEKILTNPSIKNPNLIGNYRAVQEGIATDKTAGLYNFLIREGKIDLARLIGNPYMNGTGYFNSFTHMANVLDETPAWRSPAYPEGFLAEGASKAMPPAIRARYQSWVDKMKEYEITPGMDPMDPKWVALKYWAKENNFANGGLVGYHKGGLADKGHRHGRNLPLTQKQKAMKNKNLSYYESKIDDPINKYSEGFAKIFTRSPFGITAPVTALVADLIDVYFKGQAPSFGSNGAADINPISYEPHVTALMQGMFKPFAEIAKGSATKGDWLGAGLNFVPGAGALKGASVLRARSVAYKAIDKAAMGLPSEARATLLPNATLRSNFVALKKADKVDTPEFAKARYELALSDALRAAKKNKFTALPDLKNTTYANLLAENKALPSEIEEFVKIQGKDFIFKFHKGDIAAQDAKPIENFLEGLKEGKVTANNFGGGKHQVEIIDPITKSQAAHINYDPVTGYIYYRGTNQAYWGLHLSDFLYNKAASITRIRHSDNLTPMGRPSALRIGGFMADDPYYGATTSIPNLKQYLDMLMKIGRSKKPKPSTGEARSGIGSWVNNDAQLDIRSTTTPRYDRNEFNDFNSVLGFQYDRHADLDSAFAALLRPETVRWFGSGWRTSANFPYGPNGYIEPAALPELERIIAAEKLARQSGANSGGWGSRSSGGWANGGLVQNFSNSSLKNLGVPMFENGINMVPANMLAMLHKNEAVVPANMNPFNPNASAAVSGSVYNINVELNGTNVTAQDVATQIHREMRLKEMAAGVNRRVGKQ